MIIEHLEKQPQIDTSTYVAPTATICGDVKIGKNCRIMHGAELKEGSEVRINGVVHINTVLEENVSVPIGWVAVGNPAKIFPPDKHDEIWSIQEKLNFPKTVYGVSREMPDKIMPHNLLKKY